MINISKIVTNIVTDSFIYIIIKKVHRLQILKKHGRHFYGLTCGKNANRFQGPLLVLKLCSSCWVFCGGDSDFVCNMRLLSPYYFISPGLDFLQLCCDN